MAKSKSAKKALLMSALSLLLCVSMLVGTTYAWFTDSVTSGRNIIQSGTLDVAMEWADGKADPTADTTVWNDASTNAIFDYDKWEPGYTQVRHVKIINKGTLALKYQLRIDANGEVSELADVIDVYYIDGGEQIADRTALTGKEPMSNLTNTLAGLATTGSGNLKAGEEIIVTIALKMRESAGNEYQNLSIGAGFAIRLFATQYTYEPDSFDDQYDKGAKYLIHTAVTPANVDAIDFSEEGQTFVLSGDFGALTIAELGEDSVIAFDGATVAAFTLGDDAAVTGKATISSFKVERNSPEPIELTMTDAALDITGELRVANTEGKSVLNIENSDIETGTIFVGGHTMNAPDASAEFNVIGSTLSCEENGLGSTASIWGRSGVDAKIYDSEIHTYSRGWHQSEDANDNSLTFQGADHINVDIQRSNMHLYGARSIINARPYGGDSTINFTIDESLIWVVTKSNHAEETLPVWNATEITDSALIFTKNVYSNSNPVTIKSFVYGNPVIHGRYAVTTQCGWATDIAIADGQTLTIAEDANVSIYDGAAEVNFVLSDSAKVVVEKGATLTNIGVKAADGYTLNTATVNGSTVYTVTAN